MALHAASFGRPSFGGILEPVIGQAMIFFVGVSGAPMRVRRIDVGPAFQKKERRWPDAKL